MRYFITGCAGFIGFHLCKRLLESGYQICGYDNLNNYYNPVLKKIRLNILSEFQNFEFVKGDLTDKELLEHIIKKFEPKQIIHLAAQAGVRYSIENPMSYIQSNIVGFQNIIDIAKIQRIDKFIYASSSSVYGGITTIPFNENMDVRNPISLYAATKISNELTAHVYNHLFKLPSIGLRFFTVYGPYGRPDMAMFKFSKAMLLSKPIEVYNNGQMIRDFTYIDDIIDGIISCINLEIQNDCKIYNLGRGCPIKLLDMIQILEEHLGIKATMKFMPMQAGDVPCTLSDISKAQKELGYSPKISVQEGIMNFCKWFLEVNAHTL